LYFFFLIIVFSFIFFIFSFLLFLIIVLFLNCWLRALHYLSNGSGLLVSAQMANKTLNLNYKKKVVSKKYRVNIRSISYLTLKSVNSSFCWPHATLSHAATQQNWHYATLFGKITFLCAWGHRLHQRWLTDCSAWWSC